ncbi:MAG: GNAT family N-acetyltransferase [Bacteroidales bacterium]|nr:GNAT family N-acetyltransferase [Bacteroidales bacterium]
MISVQRYTPADQPVWDAFVDGSRQGTFLFRRAYMDYHADRFTDHSLLFYDAKSRLIALLPANERDGVLYSHQGLTYGGLLTSATVTQAQVLAIFDALLDYGRCHNWSRIIYKSMPDIYHRCPSQEDEYALWRLGATLESCLISSAIDLQDGALAIKPEYCRRNSFRRLQRAGYTVDWEAPLAEFWPILTDNLREKYGIAPVHTLAEMQLLQSRFPDEILCVVARDADGRAQGGVVMFDTAQVAHVQYSAATPDGKRADVLDFLYLSLVQNYSMQSEFRFFDIGNSNEEHGLVLNENLIHFKESLGARGVVYRTYSLKCVK